MLTLWFCASVQATQQKRASTDSSGSKPGSQEFKSHTAAGSHGALTSSQGETTLPGSQERSSQNKYSPQEIERKKQLALEKRKNRSAQQKKWTFELWLHNYVSTCYFHTVVKVSLNMRNMINVNGLKILDSYL